MTNVFRTLIAAIALVPFSSAMADDAFTAIHMKNQQIGSAVHAYWQSVATVAAPSLEGFMSIHLDNQKITSAVTAYWQSLSSSADENITTAATE